MPQSSSRLARGLTWVLALYALLVLLYLLLRFAFTIDWQWLALLHNTAPYLLAPVVVGLVLALLLRARRLSAAYMLLTLVVALWIGLPLLPPLTGADAAGTPLTLVTFNVSPENDALPAALDWLRAQNADVVLLQEMGAADVTALAQQYEYAVQNEAGALFSRYRIVEESVFLLGERSQQRLLLDVAGQSVVLYNVHLAMPLNDNEGEPLLLRYDETRRNQQIVELLAMAQEETLPLLIGGDFNMSEYSPVYASLAAHLTDSYRAASWGIGATWPAGASEELTSFLPRLFRLDYVWHSDEWRALDAIVGPALGSDHLPLKVSLDLRAP